MAGDDIRCKDIVVTYKGLPQKVRGLILIGTLEEPPNIIKFTGKTKMQEL